MKKLFFILSLILIGQMSNAQLFIKEKIKNQENIDKMKYSWGYYLGFNDYDFNFDYKRDFEDIQTQKTIGFNVGLIGNMRINNNLDLRFEPGLIISRRNLIYNESYFNGLDFNNSDLLREVRSTYIHFPFLIKFSTNRLNNIKPFVVGGFSAALNLSSNEENPEDNTVGQFRTKRAMLFYELGIGIDLYLFWFKFTPSIRGVFALNDELIRDNDNINSPWTSNVQTMKTRGLFINFTFQ